jgi:hypothetical protein
MPPSAMGRVRVSGVDPAVPVGLRTTPCRLSSRLIAPRRRSEHRRTTGAHVPATVAVGIDVIDEHALETHHVTGLCRDDEGGEQALLPRGSTPAEPACGSGRPDARPLESPVEPSFLGRIGSLPIATQRLLLAAAAEPGGRAVVEACRRSSPAASTNGANCGRWPTPPALPCRARSHLGASMLDIGGGAGHGSGVVHEVVAPCHIVRAPTVHLVTPRADGDRRSWTFMRR